MDHRSPIVALAFVALAAVDLACGADGAFFCAANEDCDVGQGSGWCEPNGRCSFPDPDCPSGRRYGEYAADQQQSCVEPTDAAGSTSDDGSETDEGDEGVASLDGDSGESGVSTSDSDDGHDDAPPLPPPECGDSIVQDDEICDDGNLSDDDACTRICQPPSCEDGLHSGDETDVDCGGSCDATCAVGASCTTDTDCAFPLCHDETCLVARNCAELLALRPGTASGQHLVRPDGSEPLTVHCDMTTEGGGWTRLVDETFARGVDEAWSTGTTASCGDWGEHLGPFGGGVTVARDLDLAAFPHDELLLRVEVFVFDSWDADETLTITLDDVEVFQRACHHSEEGMCGFDGNECRDPQWPEGRFVTTIVASSSTDAPQLEFVADLDQAASDESWGLRSLQVMVR